jgi:hypothetical protein
MNGGNDGRAATRGEALRRRQNRGAEQKNRGQKGFRGRRREGKVRRTGLEISESSRVSQ